MVHMGFHMIEGMSGIMQLYQIAIPGMEDRSRILPPLKTLEKLGAGCEQLTACICICNVICILSLFLWHHPMVGTWILLNACTLLQSVPSHLELDHFVYI